MSLEKWRETIVKVGESINKMKNGGRKQGCVRRSKCVSCLILCVNILIQALTIVLRKNHNAVQGSVYFSFLDTSGGGEELGEGRMRESDGK